MIVKCTYLLDTDTGTFEPANSDVRADVLVYINNDLSGSGSRIVVAIRNSDRKHFNWVLSEKTTITGLAEIADRFAKG